MELKDSFRKKFHKMFRFAIFVLSYLSYKACGLGLHNRTSRTTSVHSTRKNLNTVFTGLITLAFERRGYVCVCSVDTLTNIHIKASLSN